MRQISVRHKWRIELQENPELSRAEVPNLARHFYALAGSGRAHPAVLGYPA
jgi:hypothetical protein